MQEENIQRFLEYHHGSRNANLFVAVLKCTVHHSLTIGIDFDTLGDSFREGLTDISVRISKLLLIFGLQKYQGYSISYKVPLELQV